MRRYNKMMFLISLLLHTITSSFAQVSTLSSTQRNHKIMGDILVGAMPALSLGSALIWNENSNETLEFSKSLLGTIGLTYGLKLIIAKERPNGESQNSFPSRHTSIAFVSAASIQKRYGWKLGIPAYLLASYVGYSRIKSKKHDEWDVLGGAAIGIGMNYIFPQSKHNKGFRFSPGLIENMPTIGFRYRF
ncbi:Phosphatase PAP2 family protein [Tenacibaculum sp. 190130A14a]|uniref:Lipid A 4'-phosphatase n=1 Tax=Tenacibaculum polynesiense TaxID=3137857 RepID=A0ABM9PC29_9FLAO